MLLGMIALTLPPPDRLKNPAHAIHLLTSGKRMKTSCFLFGTSAHRLQNGHLLVCAPLDSPSIHELLGIRRRLATDQPLDAQIGGIQATAEALELGFDEVVQLPLPQTQRGEYKLKTQYIVRIL